jgi:hypothetical protein
MFLTHADIEKLGAMHAVSPSVLSLYLTVPARPAQLPALLTHAGGLIVAAERAVGDHAHVAREDLSAVCHKLATCGAGWRGRTVAVFACVDIGLFQALPLPCELSGLPECAVLGIRPHIRPLLLALQRCPTYRVAVVAKRDVRLYSVAGEEVERLSASPQWLLSHAEQEPLVIAGRDDEVRHLLGGLPPGAREFVAASFVADPGTLTAARARDLARPYVARWAERRLCGLADQILTEPIGGPVAVGLPDCLAAVNASAVETLAVPCGGLIPGYECGRCGALSVDADSCPDWGTAPLPVPDLIEEMVTRTLEDGGQVCVLSDIPAGMAARLHAGGARELSGRAASPPAVLVGRHLKKRQRVGCLCG